MLDEEIKKEINKCSRCALCFQSCPIFQIKKDENSTCRGLIRKLAGFEQNILSKKEIKKDLKICLGCGKCKLNCPSKINTTNIFAYKNAVFYPSKLNQKIFLGLKLLPLKILYFFNFFKKKRKALKTKNQKEIYFKGCVANSQHKTTFLDENFFVPDFSCCGLPYFLGGDLESYKKAKEKNIELIKKADTVVFDCATFFSSVKDYFLEDDLNLKKLIFVDDYIFQKAKDKKFKLKKNSKYFNKTITFHKPCHLDKNKFENIENFLSNIENLNYKKLENPDLCCGFGGSYFLFHPIIALKINLKKALEIKKSKADLILSACPSCTIGLRFSQIISLNFKKTLELRDFIDKELILE